jgi:DNA-binding GntR family transcriptional regulator
VQEIRGFAVSSIPAEIIEDEAASASSGDQAYRRIRTDIVFGRLKPGQRLILDRMKPTYGVSITTLREILSRLAAERLVTAEGQRGFQVAECSADDLREIAALRLLLESSALRSSFATGDVEWEARFVAAHHKLAHVEQRLVSGRDAPLEQWKRYDFEFHNALVSACGSKALLDLHAGVYDRYLRYQMVFGVFRGGVAASEHRELLEAALARQAENALAILQRHVNACIEAVLSKGL